MKKTIKDVKAVMTSVTDDVVADQVGMKLRRYKQLKYVLLASGRNSDYQYLVKDLESGETTVNAAYLTIKEDQKPKYRPEHQSLIRDFDSLSDSLRGYHKHIRRTKMYGEPYSLKDYNFSEIDSIKRTLDNVIEKAAEIRDTIRTDAESQARIWIMKRRRKNQELIDFREIDLEDDPSNETHLERLLVFYQRDSKYDNNGYIQQEESLKRLSTFVLTLDSPAAIKNAEALGCKFD